VALYELRLTGTAGGLIDPLRYAAPAHDDLISHGDEYAFVKLRYKQPDAQRSQLLSIGAAILSEMPDWYR